MNNYSQPGDVLTLTAPYDRESGEAAMVGSIFGVATSAVASGAEGEFMVVGVHELDKTSAQAWTQGDKLYWVTSTKLLSNLSGDGQLVGVATAAAANPSSTGMIRLGGGGGPAEFAEGQQAAITSLADNGGGTADGTVASQAAPVTLTDSTGLSGTHDDTLAATTVPADITGGEPPTEAEYNAHLAVTRVIAQNVSDVGQKVIELVTLAGTAQNNLKELTTQVDLIITRLRAAGIIAT